MQKAYHVGSAASELQIIHLESIHISSFDNIIPRQNSLDFFRHHWLMLSWEKCLKPLSLPMSDLNHFLTQISSKSGMALISEDSLNYNRLLANNFSPDKNSCSNDENQSKIFWLNLTASTILDELILVTMCVEISNENSKECNIQFKIRSSDKESASKMGKRIFKLVKTTSAKPWTHQKYVYQLMILNLYLITSKIVLDLEKYVNEFICLILFINRFFFKFYQF